MPQHTVTLWFFTFRDVAATWVRLPTKSFHYRVPCWSPAVCLGYWGVGCSGLPPTCLLPATPVLASTLEVQPVPVRTVSWKMTPGVARELTSEGEVFRLSQRTQCTSCLIICWQTHSTKSQTMGTRRKEG